MLRWDDRGETRSGAPKRQAPNGDPLSQLCAVVPFVPIPPARPAYQRFDEAAGLTLLELSLRMDHVHRVTETLTFVDSTHMRRAVSVDVDLRQLTARQRGAVQVRPVGPIPSNAVGGPAHLWVPIARQSRGDLASVQIRDQAGVLVPRLTSDAIRRALVAGLASFVKTQIMASGQLQGDRFLQARWLIERAVAHYVEHGSHGMWDRLLEYESNPVQVNGELQVATSTNVEIEGPEGPLSADDIRRTALGWLRGGDGATGVMGAPSAVRQQFAQLLDIAANQQLLVVLLPVVGGDGHLHLHFDAPPVPVRHGPDGPWSFLRGVAELGKEYRVEYETQVPRHASSYHVSVEVPEEIKVRRFLLSSDANEDAVRRLADDLRQLAGEAERLVSSDAAPEVPAGPDLRPVTAEGRVSSRTAVTAAVSEVRRAELVDALARVASVSRFRNAELVAYRSYMTQTFEGLGGTFPDRALAAWQAGAGAREALGRSLLGDVSKGYPGAEQARCRGDVEEVLEGRTTLAVLGALAAHHERGTLVRILIGLPADRLRQVLQNLAGYLVESQLGTDVVTDNDPRENGAHAHWSRPELRFGPRVNEPVHIRFTLSLADEPPALAETVAMMVVCLLIVVGVMWLFVRPVAPEAGQPKGLSQADAIVAVLLLVPSILLARLDVASKRTVLGELRQTPRRLAYAGVLATGVLALITAGDAQHFTGAASGVLLVLAFLLVLAVGELVTRAFRRRNLVPASTVTPYWLVEAVLGRRPKDEPDDPDARFDAIGNLDEDDEHPRGFWGYVTRGILSVQERGHPIAHVVRVTWRRLWHLTTHPWKRRYMTGLRSVEAVSRAARTAADRRTAVQFVVAHLAGTASAHDRQAGHHGGDDCSDMTEMLAVTTLGMTVEIRTRAVSEPEHKEATARPGESRVLDVVPVPKPAHGHTVVRGHLRIGPPSSGPGRERNELLLQAGPPNAMSAQQARMLLHVVHELTWLMVLHGAMPVHITFPAAEPADGSSAAEQLRNAAAPYVRLAVSNAGQFAGSRMAFEESVIQLAERLGLGVWLNQGRASSDVAQWRRVVTFDEVTFTDARQRLFPHTSPANDFDGKRVELATFVLPAGEGVTRALAELACRVHQDGLGIHALTSWPLQQSVFVTAAFRARSSGGARTRQAMAMTADASSSPWFGSPRPWAPTDPDGWQHGYRRLAARAELDAGGPCGCLQPGSVAQRVVARDRRTETDAALRASVIERHPADSGRVPLRRPPAAELIAVSGSSMQRRAHRRDVRVVPFWVAWEVPERTDVDLVTAGLVDAFRRYNAGRDAWVTFLRARHDDRDHMRGRAKVAVPVPTDWTPSALGLLAQKVQEDVRGTLDAAFPRRGAALSFQVAWGERWLDGSR